MKLKLAIVAAVLVLGFALAPVAWEALTSGPGGEKKEFQIVARQYAFDPPVITVDQGDEVHIRLSSVDVIHGFYLEGYDIDTEIEPGKLEFKLRHPSKEKEFSSEVDEIVFTAERTGKYRYRCSHTCGSMHPFMQGELIVRPNYPFVAAVGGAVGIFVATFVVLFLAEGRRCAARGESGEGGA